MTITRNCKTEFGPEYDIPTPILEFENVGYLVDTSWHNDSCPSFNITKAGDVRLWVDHPDPGKREGGSKAGGRFTVTLHDERGEFLDKPISTNNLDELLKYLDDHWDIR